MTQRSKEKNTVFFRKIQEKIQEKKLEKIRKNQKKSEKKVLNLFSIDSFFAFKVKN